MLLTDASCGLLSTCPNHFDRFSFNFSSTSATSISPYIQSFRILSYFVWQHIHFNILISASLTIFSCSFEIQHSLPQSVVIGIEVIKSAEKKYLTVSRLGLRQRTTRDFCILIIAKLLVKVMFFAHIFLGVFHQTIQVKPFIPSAGKHRRLAN